MKTGLTCIVCPNGCDLSIEYSDNSIISIENALCPKGTEYAAKELVNPERTLTTTVKVLNGELPLASVRTEGPIPKSMLFEAVRAVRELTVEAPVNAGEKLITNLLGTGVDVIFTGDVVRV